MPARMGRLLLPGRNILIQENQLLPVVGAGFLLLGECLRKRGRRSAEQVELVYVYRGTLCLPPVASGAARSAMAQGYGGPRTGPPLPLGTPNPLPALGACGPPVPRPQRGWTPPILGAWVVLPSMRLSTAESNYNNSSSRRRPRGWLVLPPGQLSACPDGMYLSFHSHATQPSLGKRRPAT